MFSEFVIILNIFKCHLAEGWVILTYFLPTIVIDDLSCSLYLFFCEVIDKTCGNLIAGLEKSIPNFFKDPIEFRINIYVKYIRSTDLARTYWAKADILAQKVIIEISKIEKLREVIFAFEESSWVLNRLLAAKTWACGLAGPAGFDG